MNYKIPEEEAKKLVAPREEEAEVGETTNLKVYFTVQNFKITILQELKNIGISMRRSEDIL